jgi:hypothetical protein
MNSNLMCSGISCRIHTYNTKFKEFRDSQGAFAENMQAKVITINTWEII